MFCNLLLLLVPLMLIHTTVKCSQPQTIQNDQEQDLKVIIGASADIVHPHPGVKPTTPPSEFLPGVPPGYPNNPNNGQIVQTTPGLPTRPTRPQNQNQKPGGPLQWLVNWFQAAQSSRDFARNETDFEPLEFSDLNETQAEQIYEFLNISTHNISNEFSQLNASQSAQIIDFLNFSRFNNSNGFQQLVHPNKGFFDWLLELTGFGGNKPNGNGSQSPQKACSECRCGESFKQIRIVGGIETAVNAYPWMAYLKYNGRFYCGASVINNKYLLTAAHCISGFNKDRLEITLLDHDRSTPFETMTITKKVASVYRHGRYNQGGSYNNDLALVKVEEEMQFNGLLRPVCLPTLGKSFTGYTGIATGWGATQEHGQISNRLREVQVPIMSNANCRQTGYGNKITDNMLCAGYAEGRKDSCQGDSGGPLHVLNNSIHQIVGIVSWGEGCAEPNYPGVYTRVNRYLSWILANTKDACYCS